MGELQLLETGAPDFEARFAALAERRLDARGEVDRVVAEIVARVREQGDRALVEYARQLDGLRLSEDELVLDRAAIEKGAAGLPAQDRAALELAAARIRSFHERSLPSSWHLAYLCRNAPKSKYSKKTFIV